MNALSRRRALELVDQRGQIRARLDVEPSGEGLLPANEDGRERVLTL